MSGVHAYPFLAFIPGCTLEAYQTLLPLPPARVLLRGSCCCRPRWHLAKTLPRLHRVFHRAIPTPLGWSGTLQAHQLFTQRNQPESSSGENDAAYNLMVPFANTEGRQPKIGLPRGAGCVCA